LAVPGAQAVAFAERISQLPRFLKVKEKLSLTAFEVLDQSDVEENPTPSLIQMLSAADAVQPSL